MQAVYLATGSAVAIIAAVFDWRTRRIPNRLTYSAMLGGLALHLVLDGWKGLLHSAGGLLIGGAMFLILYFLRTLGAGDVKLMAAVGSCVGFPMTLEIGLYSAIAGGVIALIVALSKGRLRRTLANVVDLVRFHAVEGPKVHPTLNLENPETVRFPYGVAILAGTMVAFLNYLR